MKKKISLACAIALLLGVTSCKKNDDVIVSPTNEKLSKNVEESIKNKNLLTTEVYAFDWNGLIGLHDNFNSECSTDNDIFLTGDDIVLASSVANSGTDISLIQGNKSSVYWTSIGGYYTISPENDEIISEIGGNAKFDEFCECLLNSSFNGAEFVKKRYQ